MMQDGKLPAKPEEEKEEGHDAASAHVTVPSVAAGRAVKGSSSKEAKKEAKVDDDFFDSD